MTFIPTELIVSPSIELSRAVATELEKEDDKDTNERLNKLFDNPSVVDKKGKRGGDNDFENKLSQTQA
jgi:hypothetical protein